MTTPITRSQPILEAQAVRFAYEGNVVLKDCSFSINKGEFISLLGPSGCGKTTLLNLIAGFLKESGGKLLFKGGGIAGPGPERAVVFQTSALYDWMNVRDNITFSQICRNVSPKEREGVSQKMVSLVGLKGYEDYFPYQLSGGMKQRVGVARVLAANAEIMLMDEPFAAVDVQTRETLQEELLRIHSQTKCTIIFVTHSIDEAVFLSNRVFLMAKPGGIKRAEFSIALPEPRWQPENRLHRDFISAREEIYVEMRRELTDVAHT